MNPFQRLWLKLGLLLLAGIAALAVLLTARVGEQLTRAYESAGRAQLKSIAHTMAYSFDPEDLRDPESLFDRLESLQATNPALSAVTISWHDRTGRTVLVRATDRPRIDGIQRYRPISEIREPRSRGAAASVPARDYGYRTIRADSGAHYAELSRPLRDNGKVKAALALRYDLGALDSALAKQKHTVALTAALGAVFLLLLLNVVLSRVVLSPLAKLRRAARRIGRGDIATRLGWRRSDEIGSLARDFDRMAEELETAQSNLEALALKDALTGLLNHRAFQERLAQELRRAERERYPVSVVAIDVDHFKETNDRWGHAVGDDALRALAEAIRAALRPSDVCGRIGGDEFMVAIARSTVDEAEAVVTRLRTRIAATQFGQARLSLTISAGLAEFPRHSLAQEELVNLADGAMYCAKSMGRDCSFIYRSDGDFHFSAESALDRAARQGLINTVHALARAVDAKDGYTHSHSQRVARYAGELAKAVGMDESDIQTVRTAGVLHDVGKIGISDLLLLKPSSLTEEEFVTMRRHSELGRDIIAGAGMDDIAEYVLHLHERWDGRGYPDGLSGEEIPLESRVLHAADALEAMTSSRIYRQALPLEDALAEVELGAGTQFDPVVAGALVALVRSGELRIDGDEPAFTPQEVLAEAERRTVAGADQNGSHRNGHGTNGASRVRHGQSAAKQNGHRSSGGSRNARASADRPA